MPDRPRGQPAGPAPGRGGAASPPAPAHAASAHDVPAPAASAPRSGISTPERILQRIDWQIIRRLDGLLQGDYRSLFYGYGIDFADLREYQPEDDIRYIDWNVTARMDTPYVRQYVEDREITAWFMVDMSPSMDFGSHDREKRAAMIDLVGVMSRLLTRHGNRVGAIIYTGESAQPPAGRKEGRGAMEGLFGALKDNHDRPRDERVARWIPAKGGRNQVLRIVHELLRQPRLERSNFTDLHAMLEGGLITIKKRSLVIILSDFISAPGWERTLRLLNHRHEVLAVRLWDRREMELPDVGAIWMEDAETGEQLYVDTHDPHFRARFAAAARQREEELLAAFKHAGVEPWSLAADEDLVRAILRFASARKQFHRRHGASPVSTPADAAPAAPAAKPPGKRQGRG